MIHRCTHKEREPQKHPQQQSPLIIDQSITGILRLGASGCSCHLQQGTVSWLWGLPTQHRDKSRRRPQSASCSPPASCSSETSWPCVYFHLFLTRALGPQKILVQASQQF